MIRPLCNVNITRAINCDSIGFTELPSGIAFGSYAGDNEASRRKLFDPGVVCICDINISRTVDCKAARVIELTFSASDATFKHGSRTFRQGA